MIALPETLQTTTLAAPESERALLCRLLAMPDADVFSEVAEVLDSTDLFDNRYAVIYRAAQDLREEGAPVEFEAIIERLRRDDTLSLAGGYAFLGDLLSGEPTLNPLYHAGLIQAYATRRRLREALMKGLLLTESLEQDLDSVTHEVERLVMLAGDRRSETDSLRELGSYLSTFLDAMESTETGLSWGLDDLDILTRGLRRQRLYTILARPSVGKSAFLQGAGLNAALNHGKRVAYFSVENGEEEWLEAAYAWTGGFDMHSFRLVLTSARPDLACGAAEFAQANQQLKGIASRLYLDTQSRTVAQMQRRARRMKRKYGLDLIVADHMHEMDGPGDNDERKVNNIAKGLKALAKEMDVPVLSAAQLNRKCEDRPDKRPHPSDARGSGGIEEASDTMLLLYRPEYYFGPTMTVGKGKQAVTTDVRGYAEGIIGKNRGGPRTFRERDHVKMYFRAEAVRFESYSSRHYG